MVRFLSTEAKTLLCASVPLFGLAGLTHAGDFNNDGFDDLAIGVPGETTNNRAGGALAVFYGTSGGITATAIADQVFHQDFANVPDLVETGDRFGATTITGDFNADGCDDIAIGVPDEDLTISGSAKTEAGCVTVIFGRPNVGLQTTQAGFLPQQLQAVDPVNFKHFGVTLASGDFDADGFDDLAVGVPFENFGAATSCGTVHVFYGSVGGLDPASRQIWSQNSSSILETAENGDRFGDALAASDFNGDGVADLAVGAPGEDLVRTNAGIVHVIFGFPGSGLNGAGDRTFAQGVGGMPAAQGKGDNFGRALAALPHATSGLAIGCPFDNDSPSASGSVIYLPPGLSIDDSLFLSQNIIPGLSAPTSSDRFGSSVVVSDFGDLTIHGSFIDLAIGAPGATGVTDGGNPIPGSGVVFVLHGESATSFDSPAKIFCQGRAGVLETLENGDGFAQRMQAGNFGKDLTQDLAIGVPLEDSGLVDTGVVHVLYGSLASGLRATGNQVWTQDSTGVNENSESGDQFGDSVSGR